MLRDARPTASCSSRRFSRSGSRAESRVHHPRYRQRSTRALLVGAKVTSGAKRRASRGRPKRTRRARSRSQTRRSEPTRSRSSTRFKSSVTKGVLSTWRTSGRSRSRRDGHHRVGERRGSGVSVKTIGADVFSIITGAQVRGCRCRRDFCSSRCDAGRQLNRQRQPQGQGAAGRIRSSVSGSVTTRTCGRWTAPTTRRRLQLDDLDLPVARIDRGVQDRALQLLGRVRPGGRRPITSSPAAARTSSTAASSTSAAPARFLEQRHSGAGRQAQGRSHPQRLRLELGGPIMKDKLHFFASQE